MSVDFLRLFKHILNVLSSIINEVLSEMCNECKVLVCTISHMFVDEMHFKKL